MKKIIKYILPFAFVIFSFIYLLALIPITNILFSILFSGDGFALLFLLIAVIFLGVIIIPVYCVFYSKIIQGERLKVLFAFYNTLVIAFPCALLFVFFDEARGYCLAFFIWVLFWSILFPKPKIKTDEKQDGLTIQEAPTHFLLQNNVKSIIAICFTVLYIINLIREPSVWQMYGISDFLMFTLPLFSAFVILVFLISKKLDFELKKWLFSIALAGELINRLFGNFYGLITIKMQIKYNSMYPVQFIFSCIAATLIAIMFIGTLLDFKYIKLLKYGTLSNVILYVGMFLFNLINIGGSFYHQIDANGTLAVNPLQVTASLLQILYFIGIFILTTNKRNTDLTGQA